MRPAANGPWDVGPVLLVDLASDAELGGQLAALLPDSLRVAAPGRGAGRWLAEDLPAALAASAPRAVVVLAPPGTGAVVRRLLAALHKRAPALPVLLAAGTDDPEEVLGLLDPAVDDYVVPPFHAAGVLPRLARLTGRPAARGSAGRGRQEAVVELEGMVGRSPAFLDLVADLRTLAECDATVLIEGETGTGKELCARAIHRLSARSGKPFCSVNCGAMPRELVENELFGHQQAAFTGASVAQVGLIRQADGGTLFFDEVDCLPASAQATLLRFAQNQEYRPLGSPRVLRADVRIVAATNTDLAEAVDGGGFRRDLYYRLDVLRLVVPPLRERRDDVPLLAAHFLARYARRFGAAARRFSSEAVAHLLRHDWPGNVRELEHVVERAVAFGRQDRVLEGRQLRIGGRVEEPQRASFQEAKRQAVGEFERSYLCGYLAAHDGNIGRAARAAGKHRRAFWELMRKHSIDADAFKRSTEPAPAPADAE